MKNVEKVEKARNAGDKMGAKVYRRRLRADEIIVPKEHEEFAERYISAARIANADMYREYAE